MGYELESEVGKRIARIHVNRLRKIFYGAIQTEDEKEGVFTDCMRSVRKISDDEDRVDSDTGQVYRSYKIPIGGRQSPKWTREEDLLKVVSLFKERNGK